jgi:predicted ATPase
MKLRYIRLKNYRSFGERNAEKKITLKDGINLIVGENNAGKSNFLKALEIFKTSYSPEVNDWYVGDQGKELFAELEMELSDSELKDFVRSMIGPTNSVDPQKVKRVMEEFGRSICLTFSSRGKRARLAKIGNLFITGDEAHLTPDIDRRGSLIDWRKLLDSYFQTVDFSIPMLAAKQGGTGETKTPGIAFNINVEELILNLLGSKLKVFSEVRQRPSGRNEQVLESYDGALVADVLANLKMGKRQQRNKFELIRQEFSKLFPSLKLEVMKERPDTLPYIVIEKIPTQYEVPIERVGAGIGEMVILLTHLIASEGMIFGLDMPELHFHPHAQRLLLEILKRYSQKNQIIVITHSPTFFEPQMIGSLIVAREQEAQTDMTQLPDGYFTEEETVRLERHLDAHNKEFLFSRAVLVVDGETELGAMPVFSKALGKDFDTLGVSLVRTGKHFGIFMKLLKGLNFPYLVMADKDALVNIECSIDVKGQKVNTSPVFFNLDRFGLLTEEQKKIISDFNNETTTVDGKTVYSGVVRKLSSIATAHDIYVLPSNFEGVLNGSKYRDIYKEAEKLYDSKVIRGSYCAHQIVKQNLKIPSRFAKVIESVTAKAAIKNGSKR